MVTITRPECYHSHTQLNTHWLLLILLTLLLYLGEGGDHHAIVTRMIVCKQLRRPKLQTSACVVDKGEPITEHYFHYVSAYDICTYNGKTCGTLIISVCLSSAFLCHCTRFTTTDNKILRAPNPSR